MPECRYMKKSEQGIGFQRNSGVSHHMSLLGINPTSSATAECALNN